MRHAHAQFSEPDTSDHIRSSADCITNTSESEFVVHTRRNRLCPRKERIMSATETPAQSGRALNSTYRPEPIRVSGDLASNHVERKESQCKCLQSYKENDLSICSREGSLEQFS